MEITANSFSLRAESGLVKIVSDSAFDPAGGFPAYAEQADCDVIVESNGFRVNKVSRLCMRRVREFLAELKRLLASNGEEGRASLVSDGEELTLAFIVRDRAARIECSMNDRKEGKENSVRVKYPVEPKYLAALKRELDRLKAYSAKEG